MLLKHRKALTAWQRDWQTAEQRMAGARITEDSFIITLTKGVIALVVCGIFAWFLWAMTGPQAMVFFYRLAGML